MNHEIFSWKIVFYRYNGIAVQMCYNLLSTLLLVLRIGQLLSFYDLDFFFKDHKEEQLQNQCYPSTNAFLIGVCFWNARNVYHHVSIVMQLLMTLKSYIAYDIYSLNQVIHNIILNCLWWYETSDIFTLT